jgi:hypothetical protein
MAIEDEVRALKVLVEETINRRRPSPYDPGTSPKLERRKDLAKRMKDLAKRMLAIHFRNRRNQPGVFH